MDAIGRGAAVYFFLWAVFRLAGKRSLGQITTFDFVLLLIIAETTQQALLGEDFSVTMSFLLILILVGIDIGMSYLKGRSPRLDRFLDGAPLLIVDRGEPVREAMEKVRVDEDDVLTAARTLHGLERLEQVKYAVLERNGGISIVPFRHFREAGS